MLTSNVTDSQCKIVILTQNKDSDFFQSYCSPEGCHSSGSENVLIDPPSASEKEVKTILKLRLAEGEITKETYLDLQSLLSD